MTINSATAMPLGLSFDHRAATKRRQQDAWLVGPTTATLGLTIAPGHVSEHSGGVKGPRWRVAVCLASGWSCARRKASRFRLLRAQVQLMAQATMPYKRYNTRSLVVSKARTREHLSKVHSAPRRRPLTHERCPFPQLLLEAMRVAVQRIGIKGGDSQALPSSHASYTCGKGPTGSSPATFQLLPPACRC